ncbi:MAG: hypothetical protein EOO10_23250 [Chitinophagaceae bacterium]|nr:MAG: hypothetical protein EOO10_23250 [Chitinophagaceae bacterium]
MTHYFLSLMILMLLFSCGPTDSNQKELELKQRQLEIRESELNRQPTFAAPETPAEAETVEDMVNGIRNEYQRINGLNLTQVKKDFKCDVQGHVVYYLKNNKLVKVAIDWGFLGDGSSYSEYYYNNDKLIFIYERYVGGPANGPETTNEFRTYVQNNKTVKSLKNQSLTSCRICEFNSSSDAYKIFRSLNQQDINAAFCG